MLAKQDEFHHHPLIFWQRFDVRPDSGQLDAIEQRISRDTIVVDLVELRQACDEPSPSTARPHLIDPQVLHDPEHPHIQPGARHPAIASGKRPLDRRLQQIIDFRAIPGDGPSQSAQPRQQGDNFPSYGRQILFPYG